MTEHTGTGATRPPAGWYVDPLGRAAQRFWDGEGWTRRTRPDGGSSDPSGEGVNTVVGGRADWEPAAGSAQGGSETTEHSAVGYDDDYHEAGHDGGSRPDASHFDGDRFDAGQHDGVVGSQFDTHADAIDPVGVDAGGASRDGSSDRFGFGGGSAGASASTGGWDNFDPGPQPRQPDGSPGLTYEPPGSPPTSASADNGRGSGRSRTFLTLLGAVFMFFAGCGVGVYILADRINGDSTPLDESPSTTLADDAGDGDEDGGTDEDGGGDGEADAEAGGADADAGNDADG